MVRGTVVGREPGAVHAEGHGQVLQRDVVASAVGGVPELIDDRATGALVRASDADALARATLEALEHRDRWGNAARERCLQRFSMASVGARWAELVGEWE